MKPFHLFIISIFILEIIGRLWFISLAPQPPYYDQDEYEHYAAKMMNHGMLASHSYRTYPYPMFLAVVYSIVGYGNRQVIFFLQAIVDSITGIFVYWILSKTLRRRAPAVIVLLLYAVNPFTSGYVGVLLSEILETFFMIATLASGIFFLEKPDFKRACLVGLCAGLTAETRNAAFAWALLPIGLLYIFTKCKKQLVMGACIGLFVTIAYPLFVNWRDFREVNITTVDNFYAKEFFNGAILKVLPPFTKIYPYEVNMMFGEYYSEFFPGRTTADRQYLASKYFKKGWLIVQADPIDYLKTRVFKMWYVWQKENVFFYSEPDFLQHRYITYYANIVLLSLAMAGLVVWRGFKKQNVYSRWLWLTLGGSIVYATLVFSLTHAEYRLTIPFYPLLFMLAAVSIYAVGTTILRLTGHRRT